MKKTFLLALTAVVCFTFNATELTTIDQSTQNETVLLAKRTKKKARKGKKRGGIIGKTVSQLRRMGYRVVYNGNIAGGVDEYTINGVDYIADPNTGRIVDTSAHAFRYGD